MFNSGKKGLMVEKRVSYLCLIGENKGSISVLNG